MRHKYTSLRQSQSAPPTERCRLLTPRIYQEGIFGIELRDLEASKWKRARECAPIASCFFIQLLCGLSCGVGSAYN
jgi:hypothetical protein